MRRPLAFGALGIALLWILGGPLPVDAGLPFVLETVTTPAGIVNSVEVDAAGDLHVLYSQPFAQDLYYAFRAAGATTWTTEAVDTTGNVGTYSSLALDASGVPHVLYFDDGRARVMYGERQVTGWALQAVEVTDVAGNWLSLALAADGTPHALYPSGAALRYAVRRVGKWNVETIGSEVSFPSLALDSQGVPHASFRFSNGEVLYATRGAQGWTDEAFDARVGSGPPRLVMDGQGRPHIAYGVGGAVGQAGGGLAYATRLDSGWAIEDVAPQISSFPDLRLDAAGHPHIAFDALIGVDGITAVQYTTRGASGWNTSVVGQGGFPSLALDPEENPVVAYTQIFTFQPPAGALFVAQGTSYRFDPLGAYHLFSFPAQVRVPGVAAPRLSDVFGSALGTMSEFSWKGYSDEGSTLVQDPLIEVGKGYWINTLLPLPEDFTVDGAASNFPTLLLRAGWNLIGAPGFRVIPQDFMCILAEGRFQSLPQAVEAGWIAPVFYTYADETGDLVNNGTFRPLDILAGEVALVPLHAVYIRTFQDVEFYFDCRFRSQFEEGSRILLPSAPAWSLALSVESGGVTGSGVELGAADRAQAGYDVLDRPTPPFPGPRLVLAADHADWGRFSGLYSRSMEGTDGAEHRWPLVARGARDKVRIAWSGLESLPPGTTAHLLLPEGAGVLLAEGGSFVLPPAAAARGLQLVVSGEPWRGPTLESGFEGLLRVVGPPQAERFSLVYQVLAPAAARLSILDVQGRVVRDLGDVSGLVGTWSVEWDGRTGAGRRVASGMYLARLEIGARRSSVKILVVR